MSTASQQHLILGHGFLGKVLAARLGSNVFVTNLHRKIQSSDNSSKRLFIDVNQKDSWHCLSDLSADDPISIYCLIPPSQIEPEIFSEFLSCFDSFMLNKAILVSSTVVYGKAEREVDADSEVLLDSTRAEKQFAIETCWKNAFPANYRILRLAGLYGLSRIIGQRGLIAKQPVSGNPDAYLNLIHVDDAAELLTCINENDSEARIELGCDDFPVIRRDYYERLAELLNLEPPMFEDSGVRGGNRKCNNRLTKQRTGWKPRYPNSLEALASFLA